MEQLKVLEFFSGIGGLRLGLDNALKRLNDDGIEPRRSLSVVEAYDFNVNANATYLENFGLKPKQTDINLLTTSRVDGVADVWLMSPPCQPYTHGGKKKDAKDPRAHALTHIVEMLSECTQPPSQVFIENVRGFETSESRKSLVDALSQKNYRIEEFMLSPSQLGLPNTRMRYYCVAVLRRGEGDEKKEKQEGEKQKDNAEKKAEEEHLVVDVPPERSVKAMFGSFPPPQRIVGDFIDEASELPKELLMELVIPRIVLQRYSSFRFDVADPSSTSTTTFTKGYGDNIGKTGPVLCVPHDVVDAAYWDSDCVLPHETYAYKRHIRAQLMLNCTSMNEDDATDRPPAKKQRRGDEEEAPGVAAVGQERDKEKKEEIEDALKKRGDDEVKCVDGKSRGKPDEVVASREAEDLVNANNGDRAKKPYGIGWDENPQFRLVEYKKDVVRHFSDTEMLRMHGFPPTFKFPNKLTLRQRFMLIGNSVSVQAVGVLLHHLLLMAKQ